MSSEAHIRIDEGIKRGKKVTLHRKFQRPPEDGLAATVSPDVNPHDVLQQYLTSKTTSQIAKQYGVRRNTLVRWLRETVPAEWKEVQAIRALTLKEDGQEAVMDSQHPFHLARAREMIASAQWDLERVDHENYGPKQEVKHSGTVTFSHALEAISARRLVEHAAVQPPMKDVTPVADGSDE